MERRYRAPGRVNLIGEHTDYSGGLVLPAAIEQGIVLTGNPGGDRIRLTSADGDGDVDVAADGGDPPAAGWGRYVAAVAGELSALGRAPVGLAAQLTSDLPQGAGLSSSAALEVVVGLALCDAAGFDLDAKDLALAGQRAEQRAVGVPVGVMDHAASLLGQAGHAVLLDCGAFEHRLVPLPGDLELLIVDSGVARTLEGSSYAQRRRELEVGLAALDGRRPQDVDPDDLEDLARRARLDPTPARRLRHVVTENARVRAVEAALAAGGSAARASLGTLFADGHASMRDDFEASIPELDALVELAYAAGAVAARMTGGGFGGAIVALVDVEATDEVAAAVTEGYASSPTGRRAIAYRTAAADGARRLT